MSFADQISAPGGLRILDLPATVLVLGVVVLVDAILLQWLLELSPEFVTRVGVLYALVASAVCVFAVRHGAAQSFGAPNRVTMLRAALVAFIAPFLFEAPSPVSAWIIIYVAIVALVLDGVDGRLARKRGLSSAFGARFDMEVDTALILVLSILCWQFGKAGPWILAAGVMRYAFVVAARVWPWLARPLPPSLRRQTVCILTAALLLAVISPLFPAPASTVIAVATVAMIGVSFGVDIAWLARQQEIQHRT